MQNRFLVFGWLAALTVAFHVAGLPGGSLFPSAMAQEAGEAPADAAPADAAPADAAPADAAPAPATGGDDTSEGAGPEKSVLEYTVESLGLMYSLVFLAISFTGVALLVMNLLTARRENVCPVALVEGFEACLDEKQYQEAYELAKADDSFLGQVLSAGLAKVSSSYEKAIEAMQEVSEEENMKLEHRLSYMALVGTISPMVGLFGTVHGMIDAFSVIARSGATPKASELATGISKALLTTLIGLGIAIPAIVAYNVLKNRTSRLVLEVGILSEGLMSRFDSPQKS